MEQITLPILDAELHGWLQDTYDTQVSHRRRPALILCPGGCYRWRSPREKDPVALEFLAQGYQVFILEYSCGEAAGSCRPLRELAAAVAYLRQQAEALRIDPARVAVLGFSAGGHLAASLGALWKDPELALPPEARPDALVLCYPVISTGDYCHPESVRWVTGGDETLRQKLHLPDRVTPDFPPTFLWHGGEDTSVPPENSMMLAQALRRCRVPFEYHLFETGVHGISTCTQEVETPDPVCRAWVGLCKTWLNRRFAYTP